MKIKMITFIMVGLLTTMVVQAQDINTELQAVAAAPDTTTITDIDILPIKAEVTSVQPAAVNPEAPVEQTKNINILNTQDWGPFQWIVDWVNRWWS